MVGSSSVTPWLPSSGFSFRVSSYDDSLSLFLSLSRYAEFDFQLLKVVGVRALSLFPFFSSIFFSLTFFCFRLEFQPSPTFDQSLWKNLTLKFFSLFFCRLKSKSLSLEKKLVAHGERMSVIHTHTRQLGETYLTVEEEKNDWSKK